MLTQDVIKHFGGVPQLAKALGVSRHAIYQWPEVVPESRKYQIEVLTKGKLKVSESKKDCK